IKVGDIVEGEVTGSVDFGVFVTVEGIEGLVHISEIAWERITNPQELYRIGDQVKAKVIAIDNDKLSLSVKQLSEDPWLKQAQKLKVGARVEGTVTRITPFGAFVQITPSVEALVHVSEVEGQNPDEVLPVGQKREFKVLEVDEQARKIALTTKLTASKAKKTGK
ncbi:S1 RNA-binding domain-containing protein, partial [Candidatus Microgenomates bacterium]|nr:S1 RNA-binding domain-containing protein [Candidatus Microgenomates bacterium]